MVVRRIVFIIVVVILIFIIQSLVRSIYDLWQKQDLLTLAQKTLEEEKLKNQKLKAGLSYVESQEFIEEKARNKLFLTKEKELEVIISQNLQKEKVKKEKVNVPNWEKWLRLFDLDFL